MGERFLDTEEADSSILSRTTNKRGIGMIFSSMKWFCTCCGKEMLTPCTQAMGREWKTCSIDCVREIQWRETLSIMGKEYQPRIDKK